MPLVIIPGFLPILAPVLSLNFKQVSGKADIPDPPK
jgi:hypothetical protein